MKPIFTFKKRFLQFISIASIMVAGNLNAYAQVYDWAFKMGSTGADGGFVISRDQVGNIYVGGDFVGTVDFNLGVGTANLVSSGSNDAFIAKYDASGNYIWAFKIGGLNGQRVTNIIADESGYLYVGGVFYSSADFDPGIGTANLSSTGNLDIFIAKYDTSGNYIWAFKIGGTNFDAISGFELDSSGHLNVTGSFYLTIDLDPDTGLASLSSSGQDDGFIAKYTTTGDYVSGFKIGGTGNDAVYMFVVDSAGNKYISGFFESTVDFDLGTSISNLVSAGQWDIFIAKYDSVWNLLWAKRIGGTSTDFPTSACLDSLGFFYIGGSFTSTVDFDMGPDTFNLSASGADDIFIAKYTVAGDLVWVKKIGGSSYDEISMLKRDISGDLYISGYFGSTVDFDPGPGTVTHTGNSFDGFIAKYDTAGNYKWSIPMISSTGYGDCRFTIDSLKNVYATGYFASTVDFNPSSGIANLTTSGAEDIFIAKYSPCKDPLTIAPTINPVACSADTTLLILNVSGTELSYQWEVDEGTGFSIISNTFPYSGVTNDTLIITPYPGMNGYLYRCIITGTCNPVTTIYSDTIILSVNPSYSFSYNFNICTDDSVLIFGTFRSAAGTYYDSLQTILGCDSVYAIVLTLDPTYTFKDTLTICDGDSVFAGGAYQFVSGTYYDPYFTLTGCDSTYITELIVKPAPNANIGPDTLWVCEGQLLSFGIDTGNNDVISYSLGNSFTLVHDDSLTFTYSTSNPAPFVISEVEGINGCFSSDFVKLMNNMIVNLQHGTAIINGPFITFNANIPSTVDSFFWDFGDATIVIGNDNPTHEYTASGTYHVCLTAINECETDSDCITFTIAVGMVEEALQNIVIAPNPVTNLLYISNLQSETNITIYNTLGEAIFNKNCRQDVAVDLSAYENGLYFIELKSKNAISRRERIVKVK